MAVLRALQGLSPGQLFPLEGASVVLGRHPACDIVLESGAVSRQHARILNIDGNFYVEDLHSRNGTLLNGRPVAGRQLLGRRRPVGHLRPLVRLPSRPRRSRASRRRRAAPQPAAEAMMVDDDRPADSSTIMSKLTVSTGSTGLRLEVNTEAKLKALMEISQNLGKALGLAEVLPKLLDSLFTIFVQADRGFIVLLRPADGPAGAQGRQVPPPRTTRQTRPHQPHDRPQRDGDQGGDPFGRRRHRRPLRHGREHRRFPDPLDDLRAAGRPATARRWA